MIPERPYIYCTGENCPMAVNCKAYKPDMDKKVTYHWSKTPIRANGSCFYFEKKNDIDLLLDNLKENE